jgi:hypothetical protein
MQKVSPKYTRNIALGVLMLAGAGWGYESTRAFSATDRKEVFSFDMWCLEMRLYPASRCDARRGEDVKAYQQYRVEVEQYDRARTTREQRDQTLLKKLNPETGQDKPLRPVQ